MSEHFEGPPSGRVCGAEVELQSGVLAVLRATPGDLPPAEPGEVVDPLRCVLQCGHDGKHHGIARGLPLRCPGEVWATWSSGQQPSALLLLSDCPDVDPTDRDEACVLFNGHAGAHSWALADPDADAVRERLGLVPPQPVGAGTSTVRPVPCAHQDTETRDGKICCARCKRQLYL
jgi:hypothetical protein